MSYERLREREVYRYYQTWLESFPENDQSGNHYGTAASLADGSRLSLSTDKSLIAFAQLGCLRLNAKRGIVTLIASERQYVLAEATKTSSLTLDAGDQEPGDELWFGSASLPRSQGVSRDALAPGSYTAIGQNGNTFTAPALVVNDISKDSRYSASAYAGRGITFYSGVPITTKAGHSIGVYTVTDTKARNGLTPSELRFLVRMADVVATHLESVRADAARARGENLVLGLGQFVDGETAGHDQSQDHFSAPKWTARKKDAEISQEARQFMGMTITNVDVKFFSKPQAAHNAESQTVTGPAETAQVPNEPPSIIKHDMTTSAISISHAGSTQERYMSNSDESRIMAQQSPGSPKSEEVKKIFARAAKILRACTLADGVFFCDATSINQTEIRDTDRERHSHSDQPPSHVRSKSWTGHGNLTIRDRQPNRLWSPGFEMSTDSRPRRQTNSTGKPCKLLGVSLSDSDIIISRPNAAASPAISEQVLRRLVRRYPQGKWFSFASDGQCSSSESDNGYNRQASPTSTRSHESINLEERTQSKSTFASELGRIFPGVRNLIWLPLWDMSKHRWSAGAFLWSRRSERIIAAHDDLLYLKIFGKNIMNEVSRLDVLVADKAKATFIANISHELRSPLHGILGSVEFLQETALDSFQSSMVTAMETCGKTLLDTVEHVLDYAKINRVSKGRSKSAAGIDEQAKSEDSDENVTYNFGLEEDFDLAVMFEEVIEAVYAGQTFRGAQSNRTHGSPFVTPNDEADCQLHEKSDRQIRDDVQRGSSKFSGAIRLILDIEKRSNWWVRTQSGAVRRIVMNLFGNALKYTEKGTIKVTLTVPDKSTASQRKQTVRISVSDTGRGMSSEFLRNHAFTPFTQESEFSAGTGLGLSIVRHLVSSLGGKIEVESEQTRGTEFRVWLTLPIVDAPAQQARGDKLLHSVMDRTPGLSICMLDPRYSDDSANKPSASSTNDLEASLRVTMDTWFGMRTMRSNSMDDIVTDFFVYAEPPPIEYLLKHHGEHASEGQEVPLIIVATNAFESASLVANDIHQLTDLGRILEVVPQPCGPLKIAKALHRCLERVDSLSRTSAKPSSDTPHSERVVEFTNNMVTELECGNQEPNSSSTTNNVRAQSLSCSSSAEQGTDKHDENSEQDKPPEKDSADPAWMRRRSSTIIRHLTDEQSDTSDHNRNSTRMSSASSVVSLKNQTTDAESSNEGRVLLVDDNPINLNLLVAFMKKARRRYEAVKDGLQAVEAFKKASTDPVMAFKHILMDISMPVMDGITATHEIRKAEREFEIKQPAVILALTGQGAEGTREDMFQAGADYFLTKPAKFKDLMGYLET